MPVTPPSRKTIKKPTANSIGVSNDTEPRHIVPIQLKNLMPVGTAIRYDIKLKNDFETQSGSVASSVPGDVITRYNGAIPDREVEYFSNDPREEAARHGWFIRTVDNWKNILSLTDSMRLTRYLTLVPGVALTRSKATNVLGDTPFDVTAVTPHFAVAWDATHDGRSVLRGSFNQYSLRREA